MSYLIGVPGVAFVTDTSGKVSLAPGVPIVSTSVPAAALQAGLIIDADTALALVVTPTAALQAGLVAADDTINAPVITLQLLPALVSAGDAFPVIAIGFPPQLILSPVLWVDATVFHAPSLGVGGITLSAALVNDSEGFAAGVNVGWKLFAQLLVDVELFPAPRAFSWAYVVPQVVKEDEMLVAYPFFIQSLTGGVPFPPREGVLSGSIKQTARLTGSIAQPRLTGSITPTTHLTGSLRGVQLSGSLRPGARRSSR